MRIKTLSKALHPLHFAHYTNNLNNNFSFDMPPFFFKYLARCYYLSIIFFSTYKFEVDGKLKGLLWIIRQSEQHLSRSFLTCFQIPMDRYEEESSHFKIPSIFVVCRNMFFGSRKYHPRKKTPRDGYLKKGFPTIDIHRTADRLRSGKHDMLNEVNRQPSPSSTTMATNTKQAHHHIALIYWDDPSFFILPPAPQEQ